MPARAQTGLRITTRNLRPFQLSGLRFDGLEVGWNSLVVSGAQLGAEGYGEQSLAAGVGTPNSGLGWVRGELFRSGPTGPLSMRGGVRARSGSSLSGGIGIALPRSTWELAALDLLRSGDVDLPPTTWRVAAQWSPQEDIELRLDREWRDASQPWDRATLLWEAAPRIRLQVGLDDREPLVGFELGGAGLDVRVWARSHTGFAPTTALEVRLHFRPVRDDPESRSHGVDADFGALVSDEAPVRGEPPVRGEAPVRSEPPVRGEALIRGEAPVRGEVQRSGGDSSHAAGATEPPLHDLRSQAPLPSDFAPDGSAAVAPDGSTAFVPDGSTASAPDGSAAVASDVVGSEGGAGSGPALSGIDALSPWELEPEEAELQDRPWDVADSLTVWELRADTYDADEAGSGAPLGTDTRTGGRAGGALGRRWVPGGPESDSLFVPIPLARVATVDRWPQVADSVWRARRDFWTERNRARSITKLDELSDFPKQERDFWKPWIPYLTTDTPPVPPSRRRSAGARTWGPIELETRTRTRGRIIERRTTWNGAIPGNSAWGVSGVRESPDGTVRASLRGHGVRWKWRSDWGSVRPRNGLDVDLGRSVVGEGGFVAAELDRGRWSGGGRIASNGGDFELGWSFLALAASSGGLWKLGVEGGASALEVVRAAGATWFLRSIQDLPLLHGTLRVQTTERLQGAAALTRGDARSLRFDRRAVWARTFSSWRARATLKWRKAVADGTPAPSILGSSSAATETREMATNLAGRAGLAPWSLDLRLRRTGSRSVGRSPARTTSIYLRHRGSWSQDAGPAGDLRLGWEAGLSGTYRVGSERTRSWIACYREERTPLGLCTWGLCEVRGAPGSRATLDVSWSPLRPRSVAANTRWGVGTIESGSGRVRVIGSGAIPLGSPREESSWELRLRLALPLPLSPEVDPG